nr:ATP-binding cassette domain-containing protein [Mycoplasmopsis cynos]
MNENIIEIKNLTKIYKNNKNTGIFKLNFNVPRGSFFAFIGENGAGKTTTIKTITGSYLNYEGEVLINGINIKDAKSRQKLGYIPENAIFPKEITVYEYLKYLGLLTGQEKIK